MSSLNLGHGPGPSRSRARGAASVIGCLATVTAVLVLTTASADADDVIWPTYDFVERPTNPYVGGANGAVADAQDAPQSADCIELNTVPPLRICKVGETRATADGTLDGPSDIVPPVTESAPPGPCAAVEGRAAGCVRGGESADGRTYYKGSGPPDYHWETQGSSVQSTNHRVVKVVYNSIRIRYRGNGGIYMKTRDGREDDEGRVHYWGGHDMLASDSFSARYRISYCENVEHPNYVRCAYDWVR